LRNPRADGAGGEIAGAGEPCNKVSGEGCVGVEAGIEPEFEGGVEQSPGDDCAGKMWALCSHPKGGLLIRRGPRYSKLISAAATGAAAIFALVTGAVGNHEHAALGTSGRAFVGIAGL
jgi:hypothetical protein